METMIQRIEGAHVSFLRQVTSKQAMRRRDRYWKKVPAEEVLQGAVTQTIKTCVARRQAEVTDWVANRPIFDLYAR